MAPWNNARRSQSPHQPGKTGPDGLPHERTDKEIYERLQRILDPPESVSELSLLHQEDESTTWFGIEKGLNGPPVFQDHGRFAALMADTKQPNGGMRYPQLVSFVGETGAGKSTLIKMLVSLKEHKLPMHADSPFESPVVGSMKHDKSPTSGDVHLYADPETAYTRLPMLYADCEGLQGGETEPAANKLRQKNKKNLNQGRQRFFKSQPRELIYAKSNSEARNREWAVKRVYPRLLYTFSDVIVFVLRNSRTFESSALTLLLDWASTSLESSINQPTIPHAIIVLNATNPGVDPDEWDILTATERLMQHVANAVYENPFFVRYAEHWRKKGRRINNMMDLVRCYYADISVVRIPEKGRYMLTNAQIDKLHHKIVLHCDASFSAKDDAHMLSNVEELDAYLQAGFDHFTTKEDQPFNFVDVALRNNPIPRDFGDHILAMAAKIRAVTHSKQTSGGMRGILELEVLRAIELALGGKIPIQAFFDLIVGTSTGGIIALALGVKQWTINQCVTEFVRLCDQAFTPREFNHFRGLEEATTLYHGSKYKTRPLREALHSAFGEELLYGGSRKAHLSYTTQVAVTATSGTGEQGLVLANYSRHEESEPSYRFEFPHHLQIWEAASATSAAPSFFKPYMTARYPFKTYLDGALYHNNPASVANNERKFLWPDVAENSPDILLSLGTGKYGRLLEEKIVGLQPPPGRQHQTTRSSNPDAAAKSKRKLKPNWKRGNSYKLVAKFFSVLANRIKVNRIDSILDAEIGWKRFRNEVSDGKEGQGQESRFIRLNLDLGREPPKLDEKDKLAELQDLGTRLLKMYEYRGIIEKIAHMLIPITESMIEGMINRAEFRFSDPINIEVPAPLIYTTIYLKMRGNHNEQASLYPISGFPRRLIAEDTINETRLDKRAELIKERRYGSLAVANDPKVALSGNRDPAMETPTKDDQDIIDDGVGKESILATTDSAEITPTATATTSVTGRRTVSRDSSQTLVSQVSGVSSSASKATRRNVSIIGLRAQAQGAAQDGHDGLITVEDGDKLAGKMSATLSLGGAGAGVGVGEPDCGSDDSDGPPSEDEEDEEGEEEDEEEEEDEKEEE
ncbi:MAG: hypothetical protein Q9184_001559 [Pyrenodesmia sp. 2 TL-2023]